MDLGENLDREGLRVEQDPRWARGTRDGTRTLGGMKRTLGGTRRTWGRMRGTQREWDERNSGVG